MVCFVHTGLSGALMLFLSVIFVPSLPWMRASKLHPSFPTLPQRALGIKVAFKVRERRSVFVPHFAEHSFYEVGSTRLRRHLPTSSRAAAPSQPPRGRACCGR